MRTFPDHDRPRFGRAADPEPGDPIRKPEDPLLDILRMMLGMFAIFVAVWLTILLLTIGR
ncbi:MAG: hypothetical protein ABW198_13450 [Pseudorhodoplanes sp.]